MRLIAPSLVIENQDSFKNDVLDRKPFGEALLNLITRTDDELVISLDGKWGEGKSTFVKMWSGLLSEQNIPNIYIDAFANDYVDDAFLSIASAITSYAEKHCVNTKKNEELKDKAKQIGVKLLTWSTQIGIKAATLGIVKETDLEALKDIKEELADGTSEVIGNFVKERLSNHSKDIELMQSFKELLSEIPSRIPHNTSNRLVIIIDELDRCKPSFAVEILEKIKHLFSVQYVVFVLVMHKEQLEEAIKCIYGQNIDAHTYLQKFISLETTLPKKPNVRYSNNGDIHKYCRRLLTLHGLETWGDDINIIESIGALGNHFNLSLRQLEKAFTNLAIIYSTSAKTQLRLVPIIAFICVIKVIKPQIFSKLLNNEVSYSELHIEMNVDEFNEDIDYQRKLIWLMSWVRFGILKPAEFQIITEDDPIYNYGRSLWDYGVERERLISIFTQKLSMFAIN